MGVRPRLLYPRFLPSQQSNIEPSTQATGVDDRLDVQFFLRWKTTPDSKDFSQTIPQMLGQVWVHWILPLARVAWRVARFVVDSFTCEGFRVVQEFSASGILASWP